MYAYFLGSVHTHHQNNMHTYKLHTCALQYKLGPQAAVMYSENSNSLYYVDCLLEFIVMKFHCTPQLICIFCKFELGGRGTYILHPHIHIKYSTHHVNNDLKAHSHIQPLL